MLSGSADISVNVSTTGLLDQCMFYSVVKSSRKQSGRDRSLIQLSAQGHDDIKIELEHREEAYPNGGFSLKVKCGYVNGKPDSRLAVKYSCPRQFRDNSVQMIYTSARCAYFSRILGRAGIVALYQDKCLQMTDWHDGSSLSNYDIAIDSIEKRMKYVIDIVLQVATLHTYDLIHGDIKPENIMITKQGAFLIDLDGVRLKDEKGLLVMHTLSYLDAIDRMKKIQHCFVSNLLCFSSDVYALGLTLGSMFPEFFTITQSKGVLNRIVKVISRGLTLRSGLNINELTAQNKNFIALILSMVSEDRSVRPDSANEVLQALGDSMSIELPVRAHNVSDQIQVIKNDLFMLKIKSFYLGGGNQGSFLDYAKPENMSEVIFLFNQLPRHECHALSLLSVLKSYLTADNFIPTLLLVPADKRMDFVFDHPRLANRIPSENLKLALTEEELAFIKVSQCVMRNLESYANDRIKMHDARVKFMLPKLQRARCIDDFYQILDANSTRPRSSVDSADQYAGRAPTHTLFSFGYEQLIKKCFSIVDEFYQKYRKSDLNENLSFK